MMSTRRKNLQPPKPSKSKRIRISKTKAQYNDQGEQIYCTCRGIDNGTLMIQCDHCKEWFHKACIGLDGLVIEDLDMFSCGACLNILKEPQNIVPNPTETTILPTDGIINNTVESFNASDQLETSVIMEDLAPSIEKRKIIHESIKKSKKDSSDLMTQKVRRMACKGFQDTFMLIFNELKSDLDMLGAPLDTSIDLEDYLSYGRNVEESLFQAYSVSVDKSLTATDTYKTRYRTLQFNLKDPKNIRLKRRLLCSVADRITPESLVTLTSEDLANDEVQLEREKVARESLQFLFKPSDIEKLSFQSDVVQEDLELKTSNASLSVDISQATSDPEEAPPIGLDIIQPVIAEKPKILPPVAKISSESLESLLAKMDSTPLAVPQKSEQSTSNNDLQNDQFSKNDEFDGTEREIIWVGKVDMPLVGGFSGTASQISGNYLPTAVFEQFLTSNLTISGRINQESTITYIYERLGKRSDILVVELAANRETKSLSGFHKLTKYFSSRNRFAVVGSTTPGVKDMYICPVLSGKKILPLFGDLKYMVNVPEVVNHDRLFAVIILSTGYLDNLTDMALSTNSHSSSTINPFYSNDMPYETFSKPFNADPSPTSVNYGAGFDNAAAMSGFEPSAANVVVGSLLANLLASGQYNINQ
ncbi:transcription factor S-II, central domain-containing protein [Globomyces pollinis-pini]|nr:transcription factor S-II, central domain-containing protein [Globomyces pollinis-pini]